MNEQRVLISGASIAGLACAYWLSQNGFSVTIVEIAARPRPGGQAVDLRGAGRTVIDRAGLLDEARAIGLDQAGMSWVDARGRVRAAMPDAAITTDIIVGFPGEKDEDFERTMEVVRQARFSSAFTFQYSPRPGTPAAELADQVKARVPIWKEQKLRSGATTWVGLDS